jgi:hypothetical protein
MYQVAVYLFHTKRERSVNVFKKHRAEPRFAGKAFEPRVGHMVGYHKKKQIEIAVEAINRPAPYRPVKVVPHDPTRDPRLVTKIKGWITTEIYLLNQTPEEMERRLGFDSRKGHEYLIHGINVFRFTRPIQAGEFELGGGYTYLPGGKLWDGKDLHWPPGSGVTQWRLIVEVPCTFVKTVPRGSRYF